MAIFWEKLGIVFKGGHYVKEDIIQGTTVSWLRSKAPAASKALAV